jgi:ABC-type Fe3+-hydroxamate transport system, periplasmic component
MTCIKQNLSIIMSLLFPCIILAFAINAPSLAQRVWPSETYVVLDMTQKPVYLKQPVNKGMVFAPVADHFITVDNSGAHLLALAKYIKQEMARTLFGKIFPDLLYTKEAFTIQMTEPLGVEQTLLLKPDIILLYDYHAKLFETIGFDGAARITSIRSHEKEMFTMLGSLTGQTQRVEFLYRRRDAVLEKLFNDIDFEKPPVTTITLSHAHLHLFPSLFENFNTNLKQCNAVNLAENVLAPRAGINIEILLQLNPDVIFLYDYRNSLTVNDIYNNKALTGLTAVQNRRVYRMPAGVARMTGPMEEPLLFVWMVPLMYPELEQIIPVRWFIKNTYLEVFGYIPTESEVDTILNMQENALSANYDKYKHKH